MYKRHQFLAFYGKDDETLLYICDNVRDVCAILKWEPTKANLNVISQNIFKALRRPNHQINLFRGQCLKVYLIDELNETEEEQK